MRSEIVYRPYCGGRYDLSGTAGMGLTRGELGSWTFEANRRQRLSLLKQDSVVQATLSATRSASSRLDSLLDACDIDASNGTPGLLTFNGWSLQCFLKAGKEVFYSRSGIAYDVELLAPSPTWFKEYKWEFKPKQATSSLTALDFKYDFPYDLGAPLALMVHDDITVPAQKPCNMRLVVYGPAHNPAITIGNNKYQVDVDVADGGYLVIDGTPNNLGVTLVGVGGEQQDVFASAHTGVGRFGGNYIFEQIKPGTNNVHWNNSFSFDVFVRDERSRLPWLIH